MWRPSEVPDSLNYPAAMFYSILDTKRQDVLPLFAHFKDTFYLAGGTALALQIGHRDSIDFDFFTEQTFDTGELFARLEKIFEGHTLLKTQDERNTLSVLVDDSIKVSFMTYPYTLLSPLVEEPNLRLASLLDIGCMKLSAIVGRATLKDYVDIYYILQQIPLPQLLDSSTKKFPSVDVGLTLKSLVYFADIEREPISFTPGHEVTLATIEQTLRDAIKKAY